MVRDSPSQVVRRWVLGGRAVELPAAGVAGIKRIAHNQGAAVKVRAQRKVVLRRPVYDGLHLRKTESMSSGRTLASVSRPLYKEKENRDQDPDYRCGLRGSMQASVA
jgi:hypothetical protein